MKRNVIGRAALIAATLLVWACAAANSPGTKGGGSTDTAPGKGSVGGTDSAKVSFESSTVSIAAGDVYDSGTALTTTTTGLTASLATDYFYAGSQSLKLTGTLQQDKYDTTNSVLNDPAKVKELGARVKIATIANSGTNLDLTDRVVSLAVFVPTGGKNTAVQVVEVDSGYQQAISPAVSVTPGKWTKFYFKADSTRLNSSSKPLLTQVDSGNAYVANGAYTSGTFDVTNVSQIEVRSVGGTSSAVGDAATLYVDSLTWTNAAVASAAAAPTFSLDGGTTTTSGGTYSTAQNVTLASSTSGASVYYTLTSDGSTPADPTTSSTAYSSAIALAAPSSGSTTYKIKALAVASGVSNSAISSASFVINPAATIYSVSFDLNYSGSSGAPSSQSVTSGNTASSPTAPTRSGYTFQGWYTDSAGNSSFSFSTAITANTTLYAKWNTVLQDFESAPTVGAMNYNEAAAVVTPSNLAAVVNDGSLTNALLVVNKAGYNDLPKIGVTIPAYTGSGTGYTTLTFDVFAVDGDSTYKPGYLFLNPTGSGYGSGSWTVGTTQGYQGTTSGNVTSGLGGSWKTASITLPSAGTFTAGAAVIALGLSTNASVYAITNIQVTDGTATALVTDFSSAPSSLANLQGNQIATSAVVPLANLQAVAAAASPGGGKALLAFGWNYGYNALPYFTASLPSGDSLGNYKKLTAQVYSLNAGTYVTADVYAINSTSSLPNAAPSNAASPSLGTGNLLAASGQYSAVPTQGAWTTLTFDLTTTGAQSLIGSSGTVTSNSVNVALGLVVNKGLIFLIDDVEVGN
jgi:uncharacterized repeat protein (TIGR02543 family)